MHMNKKQCKRRHPFTSIDNFRDIGGYFTSSGRISAYHTIFRSGALSFATAEDVETLYQMGIKSIIDLRSPLEQQNQPDLTAKDNRFKQISLPVNGHGRIPVDAADVIDSYMEMISDPHSAAQIFQAIIENKKPLILHCTAGKDRTGVYVALLLLLIGVDCDDIIADYLLSFAYLRKLAKQTLKNNPDFPLAVLNPNPNNMAAFLERFIEKYQSAEAYLLLIGLTAKEINELKNILLTH